MYLGRTLRIIYAPFSSKQTDEDGCVVVQTGEFAILAQRIIEILDEKDARYFSAPEMPGKGEDAFVADLDIGWRENKRGK